MYRIFRKRKERTLQRDGQIKAEVLYKDKPALKINPEYKWNVKADNTLTFKNKVTKVYG